MRATAAPGRQQPVGTTRGAAPRSAPAATRLTVRTPADVLALQRTAGNRAVTGLLTVQRQGGILDLVAGAATAAGKALGPRPLRRGQTGMHVAVLQQRLNAKGAALKVDGIFGRKTWKAVKAFQEAHKLPVVGIATMETWAALAPEQVAAPAPGTVGPWGDKIPPKDRQVLGDGGVVMVDETAWRAEGARLVRYLRILQQNITEDAQQMLEEYPYPELKDFYAERVEELTTSARHLAAGDLVKSASWAKLARTYVEGESVGLKLMKSKGVVRHVGARVASSLIAFVEGVSSAALGIIDSAAGLFGSDPGLVAWNTGQYKKIQAGVTGLDTDYTRTDDVFRTAGKVGGGLAFTAYLGGAGLTGQVVIGTAAAGGVVNVAGMIAEQRRRGREWSDIFSDPVVLAQAAGAVAGVTGFGTFASTREGLLKFFTVAHLGVTSAQVTATAFAVQKIYEDPNRTPEQKRQQSLDLVASAIQSAAFAVKGTVDVMGAGRTTPGGGAGGGAPGTTPGTTSTPTLVGVGAGKTSPSRVAALPEYAGWVPLPGTKRVARILSDGEAVDLYVRWFREGRRDMNEIRHDDSPAIWIEDGSFAIEAPAAWIRTGTGGVVFNWSKVPRPDTRQYLPQGPVPPAPRFVDDTPPPATPAAVRVVRVVGTAEEARALYVRMMREKPGETYGVSGHDAANAAWAEVGGLGAAPYAWVRSDGSATFNFSRFQRPH